MEKVNAFLKRKNIVFSAKRYGIDALGAMAQGLFCSLLIGTILNTLGTQFHIGFLTAQIGEKVPYTIGGLTSFMSGPAMAIAIGYALQAPAAGAVLSGGCGLRLQRCWAARAARLAVLFVAIIAAECGKAVSKETKIDILVTPIVTTLIGVGTAYAHRPAHRHRGQRLRHGHHEGHGASALPDGHSGVRAGGRGPDAAHLLGRHLLRAGPHRSGRRRGCGRLLRSDGGLRRYELPGKRLGRSGEPGPRHLHAANAQHREKSPRSGSPPPSPPPSPAPLPPACSVWR